MLHDVQAKKEGLQADKVGALRARIKALEQMIFTIRQEGEEERAKLRNAHAEQVDTLTHTLTAKQQTLVGKLEEFKRATADVEDQIAEAKQDLANAQVATRQHSAEFETRLTQELTAQTTLTVKRLEDRVKHLETTKDMLSGRGAKLAEEVKQLERTNATASVKCEKENGLLRQELQKSQKEKANLEAQRHKLERDLAALNGVLEVTTT